GVITPRGDSDRGRRGLEIGIPGEVTAIIHDQEDRVVAGTDEGPAPVVHAHAVLPAAAGHLELLPARIDDETLTAHGDLLGILPLGVADLAAAEAGLDVNAVVEQPAERVEQSLAAGVAGEAGEDDPADVGLAVAVRVLGVQDVRRRADEDAAVIATDS